MREMPDGVATGGGWPPRSGEKGTGPPRRAALCRAASALQPAEIRRCLRNFRCGGEGRFLVFLHDGKPGGEILRVIGAVLVGDLQIRTEEGSAQLGDKLFHRIGVIAEALSKLPVAPGFG